MVYAILAEAPHDLIFYYKLGAWTDFVQAAITFFLTLFFNIEVSVIKQKFLPIVDWAGPYWLEKIGAFVFLVRIGSQCLLFVDTSHSEINSNKNQTYG